MKLRIYLAGGLFNAGERLHNLFLEKHLVSLGREVVLPQREAIRFFNGRTFDIQGLVEDCRAAAANSANILVANVDGGDADSGTAVEFGIAISATGRAIVYRTDFRTALDQELGLNAMFRAAGTTFIYKPCFFTELAQVENYYDELAQEIEEDICRIEQGLL